VEKTKPAALGKGQTSFENNTKTKSTIKSSDCRIIPAHCPRFKKCCAKAHGDIRRRLKRSATTFSKLGRRPGERMDAAA